MKKTFKFDNKYISAQCNLPYVFPLTIVGYIPEKKLVIIQWSNGLYDNRTIYVPEQDVLVEDELIS